MKEIKFKWFDLEDMPEYMHMSSVEYGNDPLNKENHINWKHHKTPYGPSGYIYLYQNGVKGRVMVQYRNLVIEDQSFRTGFVMDMLVESSFRKNPNNFIQLIKACAENNEYDIVYHTSNEKSQPLYEKLLKFPKPFSLTAYTYPIKIAPFLKSVTKYNLCVVDWFAFPLQFVLRLFSTICINITKLKFERINFEKKSSINQEILFSVNDYKEPYLERSIAFLKWRFVSSPFWSGDIYSLSSSKEALGYLVIRKVNIDEISYLALMDFLVSNQLNRVQKFIIRMWLLKKTFEVKADAFFTMINKNSNMSQLIKGFPFIKIPEKYLPHPTPIFMRSQKFDIEKIPNIHKMHMTLADLDYF